MQVAVLLNAEGEGNKVGCCCDEKHMQLIARVESDGIRCALGA